MLAPNQPRKTSFIRELAIAAVFISCVAFFGAVGIMSCMVETAQADPAATAAAETYPIVRYRELKNLGGGNYLCEVWTQSYLDTTLMKLTASEKAKLQRSMK
jgi:hypothetical protein